MSKHAKHQASRTNLLAAIRILVNANNKPDIEDTADIEAREGDDGKWSTFSLRVGTPEQVVRVLPSSAASGTWVVLPEGCVNLSSTCTSDARGAFFDPLHSSTWHGFANYTLNTEQNLGWDDSGNYGVDTLSLGMTNATGGPTLLDQAVVGIETTDFYTGVFGLNQQAINLTNLSDPHASSLTSMKTQNLIPSLSWAYTAGAPYRIILCSCMRSPRWLIVCRIQRCAGELDLWWLRSFEVHSK